MKTKLCCLSTILSIIVFASCTKVQLAPEQTENLSSASKTVPVAICQALDFTAQSLSDPDYSYMNFKKTADPASGKITTIEVGIYSGGGISEWVKFNVIYKNKNLSLVYSEHPADTAMNIKLNNEGYADYTSDGNSPEGNFLPTKFKYRNGKVLTRKISFYGNELVAAFTYDRNGNLTLIQDGSQFGEVPGRSEYSYNLTRTAKNQVYYDEPRGFSENTYMLLQYMDLLPLRSTNIRTSSKVYWQDDYLVYDVKLVNHIVDGSGNLNSYESASPESNESITRYTVNWTCSGTAPGGNLQ